MTRLSIVFDAPLGIACPCSAALAGHLVRIKHRAAARPVREWQGHVMRVRSSMTMETFDFPPGGGSRLAHFMTRLDDAEPIQLTYGCR
jgi:hypothetical protein